MWLDARRRLVMISASKCPGMNIAILGGFGAQRARWDCVALEESKLIFFRSLAFVAERRSYGRHAFTSFA
jgi:hypothetical protein